MVKKYIKAAIFDLDGTLVDSKKDIIDSINYILKSMGLREKPDDVIQGYIGHGRDKLISDSIGREASLEMVERANEIFSEHYREHMFDHTKLYPGVLEILEYLKGKALMVISNKDYGLVAKTLEYFNISGYFGRVMGGDNANCRKPDSCPINKLLDELATFAHEAIIVGDSEIDIKAGKLAGIVTCGLTYGIGSRESIEALKPDYMLSDIRQLKDIIY